MKHLYLKSLLFALLAFTFLAVCGCNGGGRDPEVQAKKVEYVKSLRAYFDKANGDYSRLSDADKAEFVKLSGSEQQAKLNWDGMKFGPGAADRTAGQGQ